MAIEELSIANPDPAASPTDENTIEGEVKEVKTDTPEDGPDGEKKPEIPPDPKPEKTPEERERLRMQRGIDRRTRQLAEARAEAQQLRELLTKNQNGANVSSTASDSEPLTLTRAQIDELVKAEAAKLAPTIQAEALETQRRTSVVQSLAKTWGQEKFDELSSDLDEAFSGLTDSSGRPKPAMEAVFESEHPARVIEYLADPENIDEAERISKLSAARAGIEIAKLEAKLEKIPANTTPKPSKAPAPLEPVKGQGSVTKDPSTMTDKEFAAWRRSTITR